MRDQTWNARVSYSEHATWYANLQGIDRLTRQWLEAASAVGLAPLALPPDDQDLDSCFDDTDPRSWLLRRESAVWQVQSWALRALLARAKDAAALRAQLSGASEEAGRAYAARFWPKGLPAEARADARALFLSLKQSPFSGYPRGDAFLPLRALPAETWFKRRICPHRCDAMDMGPDSDLHCALHLDWLRGYLSALAPGATLVAGEACEARIGPGPGPI